MTEQDKKAPNKKSDSKNGNTGRFAKAIAAVGKRERAYGIKIQNPAVRATIAARHKPREI